MSFSADAAAFQVQERLKSLFTLVHQIQANREKSEQTLVNISAAQERLSNDQKLKGLYISAAKDAESEDKHLREALQKIYEIRAIRNERRIQVRHSGNKETIRKGALMKMLKTSAQTLPLWVGKQNEKPPALCGAISADANYVAKVGDMVAALTKSSEGDDNWILAEVVAYNSAGKYEVYDIDEDEEQKDKLFLSKRRVTPLPLMRANPETDPHCLHPVSTVVMALYPQTTCFYKAIIKQLPLSATGEYEVLFEDSSYPEGYSPSLPVAQRYVFAAKEKKGKHTG